MEKNIYPIGSVVKLKKLDKPVMIFGYLQKCGTNNTQFVDYVGVPYPEGNVAMFAQIGFQRHDIEKLLFEGYKTEEFLPWAERIEKYGNKEK